MEIIAYNDLKKIIFPSNKNKSQINNEYVSDILCIKIVRNHLFIELFKYGKQPELSNSLNN